VYVAPISLAGIRNPQQQRTHAPQQMRRYSITSSGTSTATEWRVVVRSIDQDTMHAAVTRIAEAYSVGRSGITT
jgi:hypothetical protein